MAKELVDKWSRPLLARRAHTLDEGEAERILAARKARSARAEQSEAVRLATSLGLWKCAAEVPDRHLP